MKTQDLVPVVLALLFVGLIVGVGVLVMGSFGDVVQGTATATNDTTAAVAAGATTTTNDEVVTLSGCQDEANGTKFTIGSTCNLSDAESGDIRVATSVNGAKLLLNYTFQTDTPASTALSSGESAVSGIATDWMALTITIVVLSLILGMTIAGFAYFGKRR